MTYLSNSNILSIKGQIQDCTLWCQSLQDEYELWEIHYFNYCYCLVRHCDSSCTSASNLNFSSLKRYLSTRVIIWFIFVLFLPLPCSFFASLLLLVDLLLLLFLFLLCKCCLNNYMVLFMFFWDRNEIWFSLVSIFKTRSQSLPTVFVW